MTDPPRQEDAWELRSNGLASGALGSQVGPGGGICNSLVAILAQGLSPAKQPAHPRPVCTVSVFVLEEWGVMP